MLSYEESLAIFKWPVPVGESSTILYGLEEGRIKAVHKIRIELRPDGRYAVMNVTDELPEEYVEELPPHLRDKLSLMLLMDTDSEAEGLGYRYSQTVFYIDGE